MESNMKSFDLKEYLISGQPAELLYMQLRDPAVTFQDIVNLIQTSRAAEELFRKDDRFRELKEGKRVFVDIKVEWWPDDPDNDFWLCFIRIRFYHYLKTFKISYQHKILVSVIGRKLPNITEILKEEGTWMDEISWGYGWYQKKGETVVYSVGGVDLDAAKHKIPFDLFESIWSVIRNLSEHPASTKKLSKSIAKILLNGDVIYE